MVVLLFLIALALVVALVWLTLGDDGETGARQPEPSPPPFHWNEARLEIAEELGAPTSPDEQTDLPQIRQDHPPASAPTASNKKDEEEGLVVLVRNPRSLYVYWDLDTAQERRLRTMLGEEQWRQTTPCLRVFDVTGDALSLDLARVVNVQEGATHAFITQGLQPGRRYMVSLARRTPAGNFYTIHHSDPVTMPHEGPEEEDVLYGLYGRQPDGWSGSPGQ